MDLTVGTMTLRDVRIAYRDSGARPVESAVPHAEVPVLLIHGMGGAGNTWNRFARKLVRSGRRVIIPDLRGHGSSSHPESYRFDEFGADVLALCDHLELGTVDLVGHSLGAYAASCVAQSRPESVRQLVMEECPLPLCSGAEQLRLNRRWPTVPELWHATVSLLRHPRAVLAFDRSMTRTALEQFRTPNPEWWDRLPDITAPTMFLRGGRGGMVDAQRLAVLTDALVDCTVTTFSCGHSVHRDRYRDFAATVEPFLR
ncbi:alpha/beta fold hydrolase [Nocardia callitridis]|uniref:alpha/beta fold hydrolase n=1 Tax=Nocardia callitridis TaxID=648753 RepID=UPI003CD05737